MGRQGLKGSEGCGSENEPRMRPTKHRVILYREWREADGEEG